MIYIDSAVFVFATSIVLHGIGVNTGEMVCEASIFLCEWSNAICTEQYS